MVCNNCGGNSFDIKDEGYYCKHCGTFIPKEIVNKKIDWDKYNNERENNHEFVKKNTPVETKKEKIFKIILIILFILFALIAGL